MPVYRYRSTIRGHLSVHRETERFESTKLRPRGQSPTRFEFAIRTRGPLVCREDADRPTGLHQHRLVALECSQRAHQCVETAPVSRRAPGAAVDDEVVRSFGDLRVEVVLEHAQRTLLRPTQGRQRRARAARLVARLPRQSPFITTTVPRSDARCPTVHRCARVRPPPRSPERANVVTGAARDGVHALAHGGRRRRRRERFSYRECACGAEQLDGDHVSEGLQGFAELARGVPSMDTWSSCMPEDGIESTLAGVAKRFISETNAACAYWAIISPSQRPPARRGTAADRNYATRQASDRCDVRTSTRRRPPRWRGSRVRSRPAPRGSSRWTQ